jgi:hypothetical protein
MLNHIQQDDITLENVFAPFFVICNKFYKLCYKQKTNVIVKIICDNLIFNKNQN